MLRIVQSTNAQQAKSYYTNLTRDDYYMDGQERAGNWHGRGGELLGLSGEIKKDDFFRLCENSRPRTGKPLTANTVDGRRVGYDFVFDVPKSVSVIHALTGDTDILEAFEQAVEATMIDIESEIKTRVRKDGRNEDRVTGNAVWAGFTHFTSRPVGDLVDPHLHRHCFLFNATYDMAEQQWKAVQLGDIKRDAPYFQAVFHTRMAASLRELGYEIERFGKHWDIKGVPDRVTREFSQRTGVIEAAARVLGITSAEAKAKLGATTRQAKIKGLSVGSLWKHWMSRVRPHEWEVISDLKQKPARERHVTVKEATDHAIGECLHRQSVVPERELMAEALRFAVGMVTAEEIKVELDRRDEVIGRRVDGRFMVTTKAILADEREMLNLVGRSRGTMKPLAREIDLSQCELSDEQQRAVMHLLTTQDRVASVRGVAGTGKTTLMKVFAKHPKLNGQEVFAFAPGSEMSQTLANEGFNGGVTVAKLIADESWQQRVKGQVIWVDEAGQLDVATMTKLNRIVHEQNARLITTGDTRQHGPVARGDALRILEQEGAVTSVEVKEIRRQQGGYKEAVAYLAEHETDKGFEKLDGLGWINEKESGELYEQLAADYLAVIDQGKEAVAVSPTHAEGDRVTDEIREGLKQRGVIKGYEQSVWRLRDLGWSPSRKQDQAQYEPGMVLRFSQNHRVKKIDGVEFGFDDSSIKRGEKLIVEGRYGTGLKLRAMDGFQKVVELTHPDRFEVLKQDQMKIACGDVVRLTRNGTTQDGKHKLNNKSWHKVKGFTEAGDLVTDRGWVIDRKISSLTHAYTNTSHAAQGKTVDVVLIAQSSASWRASSREQFYVSASRGRDRVAVYTDDRRSLLDAVKRTSNRRSATELMRNGTAPLTRRERTLKHAHELQRLIVDRVRRFARQTDRERVLGGRGVRDVGLGYEREQAPHVGRTHERARVRDIGIDLERELSRE